METKDVESKSKSKTYRDEFLRRMEIDRIRRRPQEKQGKNYYHVNQQLDLMKTEGAENSQRTEIVTQDENSQVLAISLTKILTPESNEKSDLDLDFGSESYRKNTVDVIEVEPSQNQNSNQNQNQSEEQKRVKEMMKRKEDEIQAQAEENIESSDDDAPSLYDPDANEICTLRVEDKKESGISKKFGLWKRREFLEEKIKDKEKKQLKQTKGDKAWQVVSFVMSMFI